MFVIIYFIHLAWVKNTHCKYLQPVYSHWLCYVCHCNLTVIVTVNDSTNDIQCNIYSQIAVSHVTLPKAVISTVEIFAVQLEIF